MTTDQLVKINKDYFVSIASQGIKTALLSYLPFMRIPPGPQLLDVLIGFLVTRIANIAENSAFFLYTDLRVSKQGRAYVDAKVKGYAAELGGNAEDIKNAQEEIKRSFRLFAPFNK